MLFEIFLIITGLSPKVTNAIKSKEALLIVAIVPIPSAPSFLEIIIEITKPAIRDKNLTSDVPIKSLKKYWFILLNKKFIFSLK